MANDGHGQHKSTSGELEEQTTAATATAPVGVKDGQEESTAGLQQQSTTKKSDSRLKSLVAKLGLDAGTLVLMFKGSLPPIICIAMYQSTAISGLFTTLGYEIAVISVLALAILPRGKYLQTLALNLIAVCVGSAVAVLILWSGVQARLNTSQPLTREQALAAAAAGRPPYNSSQSAVCAVWLFANIWIINTLRARLPSFNLPSIVYSILVNISATYGPIMATTAQAEAFIKQLMTSMLLALAISTGVSLLVFPVSSRTIVMAQFRGSIGLLRRAVGLQRDYLRTLEREDMFALLEPVETSVGDSGSGSTDRKNAKGQKEPLTEEAKAAEALKGCITQLRDLAGKIRGEITFAKRDAAWGKLSANDLGEIFKLLRSIFIPITGLSSIIDIFRRASEHRGWDPVDDEPSDQAADRESTRRLWNVLMQQLHEPFSILAEAIDQGLEHAGIQLELLPRPKAKKAWGKGDGSTAEPDVEDRGGSVKPGEPGFARVIDDRVKKFYSTRSEILQVWARERGLMEGEQASASLSSKKKEQRQAQLYVLLYLEQLMHATGEGVQDLVAFADGKVDDGTMQKNRLQLPTLHRLRKWFVSVFSDEDSTATESPDILERGVSVVYLGDGFGKKKDPEHLPASNAWEKFGNGLRKVSKFLGSSESMFGLRCACATMTVGVVCYLEDTQVFFQQQRLVWALIIIGMGMTQTSGQSIFGFLCRVGGSFLAMVLSLIVWYIVDQKTPGIFVFSWIFLLVEYYFLVKYMRFISAAMITFITQVLIIGYELQVRKIGIALSQKNGQPYYPTYELAPYRLATVAGGCVVAFFWTVFPVPLTDRTWLRRDLGATLYLLANYFSVVNETMKATLRPNLGSMDVPGTPAHQLLKVRQKLFSKLMLMLPSLQTHSQWQKFEPSIGGRFPREAYDDIILRANRIMNYLTLISYTITWQPRDDEPTSQDGMWKQSLGDLISQVAPTHYTILSTLTLLSNSLLSGQSLPPYIPLPRPYELTRKLLDLTRQQSRQGNNGDADNDPDTIKPAEDAQKAALLANILDARNMEERGYSEFAVLQVCGTLIIDDLEGLIKAVEGLVGVVDFSFRVDISDSSLDTVETVEKGKGGPKED